MHFNHRIRMPSPADRVAPELRHAEHAIDRAYLDNKLVERPFPEAAWCFLAACEEYLVAPFIQSDVVIARPSGHEMHAQSDSIINLAKWPLRWLRDTCSAGGHIPHKYNAETYDTSMQLLDLSDRYHAFESVYTYASIGIVDLHLDDMTIVPRPSLKSDACYEAYDRLADLDPRDHVEADTDELLARIEGSLRLSGEQFSYRLTPGLVSMALASVRFPLGPGPSLPPASQFSRYSTGEFQRFAQVLRIMCFIHLLARIRASRHGLLGCGYASSLLLMGSRELHKRLVRYTGLPPKTVAALLQDLTYGARSIRSPDPALQPVIGLLPDQYAIAPSLARISHTVTGEGL